MKIKAVLSFLFLSFRRLIKLCGIVRALISGVSATTLFYSPAIIALAFKEPAFAGAYVGFWALPITPGLPTVILMAVGILIIISPKKKRKALKAEFDRLKGNIINSVKSVFLKVKALCLKIKSRKNAKHSNTLSIRTLSAGGALSTGSATNAN